MATASEIGEGGGGEADGQFQIPIVPLGRLTGQPGVEQQGHVTIALPFKLADDGPSHFGSRSPMDPAHAVAALPRAQAVIVPL